MKKTQNKDLKENAKTSAQLYMQHSQVMIVYTEKSDREVWASFKNGDESAFNYIYRKYVGDLFNYGMQVTPDDELVRDCLQKMFIDLRNRGSRLGDVKSIKGYLFTVFHRELFKLIRGKRKTESAFLSIEDGENHFFIEASHETQLIAEEFSEEKKKELEKALNQLTLRQRQAIILLYQEELSYKEIAEIMQFKEVKTARSLIYKAMTNLKEIFEVK
ncbi:sigma-70 family RNA polymerase sigma factor [Echinicola jeungdonensis]|uniref:RNA polymerase sigma factor n=1 Tax=Echinicola jeungdonensis TaxID=709343 RepID=A0ABV5J9V7_9BACT|nr:sigma-70 family RNA polymerase sigma factor [Echinicola jeungdonensis]MDN3670437.1 sigma-70 family RNA polymerase sigma factor [Echinicola jeungdonensis]